MCIGVGIVKSVDICADTMVMTLIGIIAHMYVNMLYKGDARQSK